jgi:hypothetical protein
MGNLNIPRGLIPYRKTSGQPWSGGGNAYYLPASYAQNVFSGDPVTLVDNSADPAGFYPTIALAAAGAGNFILGPMISPIPAGEPTIAVTRDLPPYHQASTAQYVLVADDPDLMFEIQDDGVNGGLPIGAAGRNCNLVAGAGSTTTGYSGWQLLSASLSQANTGQVKILRLLEQADNAIGANAKWLVQINLSALRNQTGI